MKKILLLLMLGLGWVGNGLAVSRQNQVWASGNTVFGQGNLSISSGEMPGVYHTLTVKARLTSPTGKTTGWVQKTTLYNSPNSLTIPMTLYSDYGDWVFEVMYSVLCPRGGLTSNVTSTTLFKFGHSTNCLFIQSGTQQVINYNGTLKWYALYNPAIGCRANCVVSGPIGIMSPKVGPAAPAYVNMKYNWVYLSFVGQTYCLEYFDIGRNPCSSTSCNDTTGF